MFLHTESSYDYHFIIKKLAKEFEGELILKNTKSFQFQQQEKLKGLIKMGKSYQTISQMKINKAIALIFFPKVN